MNLRLFAVLALVVTACGRSGVAENLAADLESASTASSAPLKAEAELENGLPYDACTWVIHLGGALYTPDAASVAEVERFAANRIGRLPVTLEYSVTGESATVQCGWGHSTLMPSLSIRSIAAR